MALTHYPGKALLLSALVLIASGSAAQINDPLDGVGDESYPGVNGFGAFNWVNALNFGFTEQQGANAFLSNYTGLPIPDIGMIKPLSTLMENTTYRVSFHCSRYSSLFTLALEDYDTLYIGSRNGTMVWDTVPTPSIDFEWVRWSGLFTPAPEDIGQPFTFGFSLTLNNQTSFALDGPMTATDVSTGITQILDAPQDVVITRDPDLAGLMIRSARPITQVDLFDLRGARWPTAARGHGTQWHLATAGSAPGVYVVRMLMADGTVRAERVSLH